MIGRARRAATDRSRSPLRRRTREPARRDELRDRPGRRRSRPHGLSLRCPSHCNDRRRLPAPGGVGGSTDRCGRACPLRWVPCVPATYHEAQHGDRPRAERACATRRSRRPNVSATQTGRSSNKTRLARPSLSLYAAGALREASDLVEEVMARSPSPGSASTRSPSSSHRRRPTGPWQATRTVRRSSPPKALRRPGSSKRRLSSP